MNNQACDLFKVLADETRLRIINILAKSDSYIELIASKLDITEAAACYHLKKMEHVGLVKAARSQFYIIYSLNTEMLDATLRDMAIHSDYAIKDNDAYRADVIKHFFKYGKLVSIPVQQKKREIVLMEIGKIFEVGKIYDEKEVNEMIHQFHEDHCTIRRELIALRILQRNNNKYWKGDDPS